MAGKSKHSELELPVAPAARPSESGSGLTPVPFSLDFKLDKPWRIERFESLVAEFQLRPYLPAANWELVSKEFVLFARDHDRQWVCVRRLYGIAPVVPPVDMDPKDLRAWSREELKADGYEVQAELDGLRAMWNDHRRNEVLADGHQIQAPHPDPLPRAEREKTRGELALDDKVLEQFQFPERLFKINVWDPATRTDGPREESEVRVERDWFIGRVKDWAKMLKNAVGGPIARNTLMNELYLRRLETQIATASTKEVDKLYDRKDALTEQYNAQVGQLQSMFPDMAVASQISFKGSFSDAMAGRRDYYAFGDTRLIDRVFTALELEFAHRESRQVPMRHRFTLSLAIAENIHHIYDPNFRPSLKPAVLKQMEAGYRAAAAAAREAQSQPVVDLERGVEPGTGDQFEDFLDAACPECRQRISSSEKKCPHCGIENPNDQITETYQ